MPEVREEEYQARAFAAVTTLPAPSRRTKSLAGAARASGMLSAMRVVFENMFVSEKRVFKKNDENKCAESLRKLLLRRPEGVTAFVVKNDWSQEDSQNQKD